MPKLYDLESKKRYLIEAYQSGRSFADLGRELECNECTIRNFIKKHVELRVNPKAPKDRSAKEQEIIRLHAADVSAYQMAIDLNIPISTLARTLKKLGLDISHRSKIREDKMKDHEEEVIARYLAGESEQSIADSFNCDGSTVSRILTRNEVTTRFHYTADHTFFDKIDTEEKAYVLGYFTADGCNYSQNNIVNIVSIDLCILERMKICWNYTGPIYKRKKPEKFLHRQQAYELSVSSKNMSDNLKILGCDHRKTFTTYLPAKDLLPEHLLRHYIRGLCDGDGSISKSGNPIAYVVSLAGTKPLLEPIRSFINSQLGTSGGLFPNGNIFEVKYGGNLQSFKVAEFLYKDATIYLPRKYNLYLEMKSKQVV